MPAVLAVLVTGAVAAGADYEQTVTLREPLGYTWTDELVHHDLAIREPGVAAETFALLDARGAPVPVQTDVLDGKPEAVKKVRLWFKMTLGKNETAAFKVTYNDARRAAALAAAGAAVREEAGAYVLSTGVAEIRVARSAAFPEPRPLADVAPVLGIRLAGGTSWYGQWREESAARVKGLSMTIEAAGPVFAQLRIKYELADKGQAYELMLRGVAGEPWIDVVEKYRLPKESRRTVSFGEDLKPVQALWLPWFVWARGEVRPEYDVHRAALDALERGGEPFTTLRPKWAQTRDHAQVCLAVGSGSPAPAVGALMTSPADWERPYDQFVPVRALEGGAGLAMEFPLVEGRRHWAILAGPVDRFDSKPKLQHLMRRQADIPLDRVLNEWVFQWKRDPKQCAPHILTTWDRLVAIRAEFAADADTPAVRLLKRALAGEDRGEKELAAFLAKERLVAGGEDVKAGLFLDRCYQDDFFNPTTYPRRLARALERGDLESAGGPADGPQTALVGYVFSDLNYWPGYANGWDPGNPNFHTDMYKLSLYAAARLPDHPHARQWMKFAQANLRDDLRRVLFMPGGPSIPTPSGLGTAPSQSKGGAGRECPGYSAYAFGQMLAMMAAAGNSGLENVFKWPEVRAHLEYLRNLHTPPDPRLGRRTLASIGDTHPWQDRTGVLFGMAAAGLKDSDPKFASECMAMYRHYYGEDGSGSLVDDLLLVDPSVPAGRLEDAAWTSAEYAGFGAVLRSRFGTPRETFATFKCGPARGHYQGDELSFHFYGAGMPIALDWHSGYKPRPDQEHMHNRANFGDDENMDAVGKPLAFRASDAGDLVVGEAVADRLRKMPHYPHEIVWQAVYPRRALAEPARYRRYLLLVKHPDESPFEDYLVIRDEFAAAEPATFNLFVLARSIRQDGRLFRFDGQLDADAAAYFAAPDPKNVTLDRWSWPTQDSSALIPPDFRVGKDRWREGELEQWLRVRAAPREPFLVVLYPFRKGRPVPDFQPIAEGRGVRASLGRASEEVFLATEVRGDVRAQAAVRRDGRTAVLLKEKELPPLAPPARP
jgi:hypothetical protein